MNKFNISEKRQWRKIMSRVLLIVISVTIIVWFIPRNSGPQFRYDVGKPWMYGSLIAKFDFPIYKTDEAIKAERDSLMRNFEPYFNLNTQTENRQLTRFFQDFKTGIPGLPVNYASIVADKLHQLYQTGIMGTSEFSSMAKDTTAVVRIVDGKTAVSTKVNRLLSTMSAYCRIVPCCSVAISMSI